MDTNTDTDMGTAGPVIKVGATSRGGAAPSGRSGRPSAAVRFGGGPFGGGARSRGGPRGRARRGDVRASILALLKDRPMHGYEMIQEIGERSGGAWKPSPGSVYPTLQLLEDEGLIVSASEGGKKLFTLTDSRPHRGRVRARRALGGGRARGRLGER